MKRRTAREKALQAIFQMDVSQVTSEAAVEHVLNGESNDPYLNKLVTGTAEHIETIDEVISNHLEKWTIDRLANVDRNLLKLSVYELMYCRKIFPQKEVTMNPLK